MPSRRPSPARERLLATAVGLLSRRGYHATGVGDVLAAAKVPSGVLYHHFGSKEALAVAAIGRAGRETAELFASLPGGTIDRLDALAAHWRRRMVESDFTEGCPVACSALEAVATSPALREAAARVYTAWLDGIATGFEAEGWTSDLAQERAVTALSSLEGALLLSQTLRSTAPLDSARAALVALGAEPTAAARAGPARPI